MSRSAYKSVVESQSHAVERGEMSVYDLSVKLISTAKRGEQRVRLSRKIITFADVYKALISEIFGLLGVAQYNAFLCILTAEHVRKHLIVVALEQNKRCFGSIMSVFHTGGERALVFLQGFDYRRGDLNFTANTRKGICSYSSRAQKRSAISVKLDDSGFKSYIAFSAVYYCLDSVGKIAYNVFSRRGGGAAGKVG